MLLDLLFFDEVHKASYTDPLVLNIKYLANNLPKESSKFKYKDNLLFFEECLFIPKGSTRMCVLQIHHDFPTIAYFGFNKTLELLSRDFWWPKMWKDVKTFVLSCDTCLRSKNLVHWPYGLFQFFLFQDNDGHLFLWILLQISHHQTYLILSL